MPGTLYEFHQIQPNSGWSKPAQIAADAVSDIVVGQNADGRAELFFIADAGQVFHMTEVAAGNFVFGSPTSLRATAKHLALGRNADGRLEVFYVGMDNNIYHNWQSAPNSTDWPGEFFGGQAKRLTIANNADGRLELFYIGMDDNIYHNWEQSPSSGPWPGARFRGKAKRLTLIENADGRLELIYVGMDNGLYHNWQTSPNGPDWAGGVSGATADGLGGYGKDLVAIRNGAGSLEIFYIGTNDGIYHNWQNTPGGGWHGEASFGGLAQQLCLCRDADARLELFYIGMDGWVYHNWQSSVSGPWAGGDNVLISGGALASITNLNGRIAVYLFVYEPPPFEEVAPPGGLGSWSNYAIYNDCRPIESPVIEIDITTDLVFKSNGPPGKDSSGHTLPAITGFSWQMNCYAAIGDYPAWQQYVLGFDGTSLYGQIDNWYYDSADLVQFKNTGQVAFGKPSGGKLLKGTKLTIALHTDESSIVTGVTFTATDPSGRQIGTAKRMNLADYGVSSSQMAPIVAFIFVLVGPGNSESVTFASGSGTFRYNSPVALMPLANEPPCANSIGTAETSNVSYGVLKASQSFGISQSFSVGSMTPHMAKPVKATVRALPTIPLN